MFAVFVPYFCLPLFYFVYEAIDGFDNRNPLFGVNIYIIILPERLIIRYTCSDRHTDRH